MIREAEKYIAVLMLAWAVITFGAPVLASL